MNDNAIFDDGTFVLFYAAYLLVPQLVLAFEDMLKIYVQDHHQDLCHNMEM